MDKAPEQVEAELKLQSDVAIAEAEAKAEAEVKLQAKIVAAGELHFVHEHRVFVPVLPRIIVPGHGERTALDICVDEEAQRYLVECGSGLIKEIE
jgi:hypothetical protein